MKDSKEITIEAERTDTLNWIDGFDAAPDHVKKALGLESQKHTDGHMHMLKSHIPFCCFNMVMNLGCPAVPDDDAFAAIDAFYGEKKRWIMSYGTHTEPADLDRQLIARNYGVADSWDRVILHGKTPELETQWAKYAEGCELVTPENMEEWQEFIRKCYSMPPEVGDWLKSYVNRRGWIHALLRKDGKPTGEIVMVRSLYYPEGKGWGWLGIDAPVPGVMADCYEDDQKVVAALLQAAAQAGVQNFVSDIEAPNDKHEGPAYQNWSELGFSVAYRRTLYSKEGK
jgi:hypothetical protein